MENNYYNMVRPPTEQTLTLDELKQYYSSVPCTDAPHMYVINSEDRQFLQSQLIITQDPNLVNSEGSHMIIEQANLSGYEAEGVQQHAPHIPNFSEKRVSDNFRGVRQVCYAPSEDGMDRIALHQQNQQQQQQRIQHLVQQHVAPSQQHTSPQMMRSIMFPHPTVLVQQNTQHIVNQQAQEHITAPQQQCQQIHVYQSEPQQTRIVYEQPSTVAYKPVSINLPVAVEHNQSSNAAQAQKEHGPECIQRQEIKESQTSSLVPARLQENSVPYVHRPTISPQQPRMLMSGQINVLTTQGSLDPMSAQINVQATQGSISCQQQQNKFGATMPNNNNCVRTRQATAIVRPYHKQSPRTSQAAPLAKQVVASARNEGRQVVIQPKPSGGSVDRQLNDLDDLEDSITAAVVQKVPGINQQAVNSHLSNIESTNSNMLSSTPICQQRSEARASKNCSRARSIRKNVSQNSYLFSYEHSVADNDVISVDNTAQQSQLAQQQNEPERDSARMLVILPSGEQRLITFTLPKETCALQDLLDQVGIPYSPNTDIQCVKPSGADVDYIVTVGPIEQLLPQPSQLEISSPEKGQEKSKSPEPPKEDPPKYIEGMLALCKICGYTGMDFNKCQRCKRKFAEEPKSIPQTPINNLKRDSKDSKYCSKMTSKDNFRCSKDGPKRSKKSRKDPEPEVLTLSSDEEGSKQDQQTESTSLDFEGPSSVHLKEPVMRPDMDKDMKATTRRDPIDISSGVKYIVVECRTVRIGSYKYTPTERVMFCTKGIRIAAFSVSDITKKEVLFIDHSEIVKVLAHFGKIPVIFVYTVPSCALYIRDKLNMVDANNGLYFDSCSTEESFRRITLFPSNFTEDFPKMIQLLYSKSNDVLDHLTVREADEILAKITVRDRPSECALLANEIRQILIYPPGKGGIPINTEDYGSLAQDQFLNDVIIDFYLKYLCKEILSEELRNKTHVFSSFFYKRLTTKVEKSRAENLDSKITPAQKRHNRVKNWTKNVNIFEKDYIIIPINESSHWFLAIICFPGLKGPHTMIDNKPVEVGNINSKNRKVKKKHEESRCGNLVVTVCNKFKNSNKSINGDEERDEAEGTESELEGGQSDSETEDFPDQNNESECIKQPCILIFDSLAGAGSRQRVVATLRDYLTCEYQLRTGTNDCFTRYNIRGCCPRVPQQNNFTDCGLYLLQYVEHFFKVPIRNYTLPIKELADWFEEIVVTRKREEISNLIKKLVSDFNPDSLPLPDITFPTLNGKLIEETQEGGDDYDNFTEIEEMDDEEDMCGDEDCSDCPNQDENGTADAVYVSVSRGEKRSAEDHDIDSESVPIRRRFTINDQDKILLNGRVKFRYN